MDFVRTYLFNNNVIIRSPRFRTNMIDVLLRKILKMPQLSIVQRLRSPDPSKTMHIDLVYRLF